jgi:TolA-binding protein
VIAARESSRSLEDRSMVCALSGVALLAVLTFSPVVRPDAGDEQYQFIVGLCEKQLFDMAVKEGEAFLRDHAGHSKEDHARYRLAGALFEIGKRADAAKHFEKLTARKEFEFATESWFRLGQCRLDAKDLDGARTALDRVVKAGATKEYLLAPAAFLLGETAFQQGDFAAAETAYATSLAKDPKSAHAKDARYGIAWSRFRTKDHAGAVKAIGEFLGAHGKDPLAEEMRFLLGEAQLELGRPQDAIAAYAEVRSGPFADAAQRGLGFARLAAKDEAGAAREFATLIDKFPTSRFAPEAAIQGGSILLKADDAKGALALLSSKAAGTSPEAQLWRARAEAKLGDAKGALKTVEAALAKKPEKNVAEPLQVLRGDLLADLGDVAKAGEAYSASASDYALHAAAVTKLNAGDVKGAAALAKQLLERFADSEYRAHAELVLGEQALAAKNFESADEHFAAAAKAAKDDDVATRAASRLAWCAFLAGDSKTAAKRFGSLVERKGADRDESLYMVGRAEEAAGRNERAVEAYRRHVADHPESRFHGDALLGMVRLASGGEALRAVDAVLAEKQPVAGTETALLALAERLRAGGDAQNADAVLGKVVTRGKSAPPAARYALAYSRFDSGATEEAAKLLDGLLEENGLEPPLRAAIAELDTYVRLKLGDATGAAARLAAFAKADGEIAKRLELTRLVARDLAKAGDTKGAERLFAELELGAGSDAGSLSAEIAAERVYLALDRGDAKGAATLIGAIPQDVHGAIDDAAFFTAEALFEKNEFKAAAPLYGRAAHSKKLADKALYKAGFAALRLDDFEAAEGAFAKLVAKHEKSPLVGEGLFLLGEARFRLGKFEAAIEPLVRLRKEQPAHATLSKALFRLGVAFGRLDRYEECENALTDLVRRFPDFQNLAEAELWRGRAFAARGNARSARSALEKTIALDKGELAARARIELGRLHAASGEHEKALAEFLKVAVLFGGEDIVAESLLHAGESLESLGDKSKAQAQYEELVAKYPGSKFASEAKNRIARIRTL